MYRVQRQLRVWLRFRLLLATTASGPRNSTCVDMPWLNLIALKQPATSYTMLRVELFRTAITQNTKYGTILCLKYIIM